MCMYDKIKKKFKIFKSKQGMNTLTLVVGAMMMFVAVGGLADLTILQTKFSALSTQTGYVSRVVSSQGGITTSQIENYHGNYVTSQELYRNIKNTMNQAGIADKDWAVFIGNRKLTSLTNIPTKDYGERLKVRVSIKYNWTFTSNFIPGRMANTRTSETEVITTYRIREGDWS